MSYKTKQKEICAVSKKNLLINCRKECNAYLIRRSSSLLLLSQLKVLGTFHGQLLFGFALLAFHSKRNFLGRFGFFMKHWFGLSTKTLLFLVIPPSSLRVLGSFTCFVLRHFMNSMFAAFLSFAKCSTFFRAIYHFFQDCRLE